MAADLDPVLDALASELGLAVAHRDPSVATFGLVNAVLPVGSQFLEVVSPTREGTAAGRQLERMGGDGGYMVTCQTDDQAPYRERASELGIRAAFEFDDHGYQGWQLHPGDTGGSFLEIDVQPAGDDDPWMPAGPDWQRARRTDVVALRWSTGERGLVAVDLHAADRSRAGDETTICGVRFRLL